MSAAFSVSTCEFWFSGHACSFSLLVFCIFRGLWPSTVLCLFSHVGTPAWCEDLPLGVCTALHLAVAYTVQMFVVYLLCSESPCSDAVSRVEAVCTTRMSGFSLSWLKGPGRSLHVLRSCWKDCACLLAVLFVVPNTFGSGFSEFLYGFSLDSCCVASALIRVELRIHADVFITLTGITLDKRWGMSRRSLVYMYTRTYHRRAPEV